MRKYGCLQGIFMSFYSPAFYRDVVQNWTVGVLLYLVLVLACCWALLTVNIQKGINIGYTVLAEQFFPQVPEISIKSGELSTPENRPYEIVDHDKRLVAIIDTSGKYQNLEQTNAVILVTKHAFFYKDKSDAKKSREFSRTLNLDVKPVVIQQMVGKFINWAWVVLFPLLLLFSFIYRLIQAALYAILGELFTLIAGVSLTYGEVFKISIFAITPAIILGTVLDWYSLSCHHMWLLYFALSMGYIIFGILANKKVTQTTETNNKG